MLSAQRRLASRIFISKRPRMPRIVQPAELHHRNTVTLARWLLGKVLVRTTTDSRSEHIITEVEAYHTEKDLACHAAKGRTKRTEVLYGAGGHWYVYLCYGIHEMLNLVTGPADHPAAVLIRGVDGIVGPGRVTKRLGIDRALNGAPATPASGLHVEDHGIVVSPRQVKRGPRVGIDYAGEIWAAKPWRFQYERART
jgi:DNA-3-methyladenine glycosylase